MTVVFKSLLDGRVRCFNTRSTTLLLQSLWLMLFCLGWASTAQATPAAERAVLTDLYASTNGASWTSNANWNGGVGTECTWSRVSCDVVGHDNVNALILDSNNLVGTLPSLNGLTILGFFSVMNNQLSGSIPPLGGLTALKGFWASNNQLTGSIPTLNRLTGLQTFSIFTNKLSGSIPSLSGLTALQLFNASSNQLTGSIPSLSGLTALQSFNVSSNQLTGTIPSLSGLTALQSFQVAGNQLTGPVPAAPTSLLAGKSNLCGNSLVSSGNPAIDSAWVAAQSSTAVAGGNWLACQKATPSTYTLTVTRSGSGTITSNPAGINCGATCSGSFARGASVKLTATPSSGSFFVGWRGDCSGAGACVVSMNAAKNVTATFKPVPFAAAATSAISATSATIAAKVAFNADDVGKSGAVFITAWVPLNGLGTLGISTAASSKAMRVTTTNDNPALAGEAASRQASVAVLAATSPNAFVLVQLTTAGWQLVENGQLIPYATGVLGDALASQSILNNTDPANLLGAQFCVGYGTSAADMINAGRMLPVATIPDASATTTNGSCNVALNPYTGLWYNVKEEGWGMSVTQHDSMIFAVPYTYDSTGQPTWYVMSSCPIVTAGSCTGDLYKVSGGTSPAVPWNGAGKAVGSAGSGTLSFDDANHGRFAYSLNGVAGSRTIERQTFSNGTAQFEVDYTDLWWNANEDGWGVALTQDHGIIFAAWYAYEASGKAIWLVASNCTLASGASGNGCSGDLYQVSGGSPLTTTWNGANKLVAKAGSVSFTFSDADNGTMTYTLDGVADTRTITRQGF